LSYELFVKMYNLHLWIFLGTEIVKNSEQCEKDGTDVWCP